MEGIIYNQCSAHSKRFTSMSYYECLKDGMAGLVLLLSATPEAGEEEHRVCVEKVTGKAAQALGRA